jgi:hypothetical protein
VAQSSLETRIHPGFDFINVLREAFTILDPKSVKKIDNLTVFFTLLGSAHVIAKCSLETRIHPGVDFINNIFLANCFENNAKFDT